MDGEAWLAAERRLMDADDWLPPDQRRHRRGLTFEAYSGRWLDARELKPSTTALYRGILARTLVPAFGDRPITRIMAADVRAWYATLDPARKTTRAHAYSLLRAAVR